MSVQHLIHNQCELKACMSNALHGLLPINYYALIAQLLHSQLDIFSYKQGL